MNEFKAGDKVYSLLLGNGTVTKIENSGMCPVKVFFDVASLEEDYSPYRWFTPDGKHDVIDIRPSIYHGHDLILEISTPEYEYQILYISDDINAWVLSIGFYKSIEDFHKIKTSASTISNCQLFEQSKRIIDKQYLT